MAGSMWAASLLPHPTHPGRNPILTSSFCCFEFEIKLEASLKKKKKKRSSSWWQSAVTHASFPGHSGRGEGGLQPLLAS